MNWNTPTFVALDHDPGSKTFSPWRWVNFKPGTPEDVQALVDALQDVGIPVEVSTMELGGEDVIDSFVIEGLKTEFSVDSGVLLDWRDDYEDAVTDSRDGEILWRE